MTDVFLSYSHRDIERARRLAEALAAEGVSTFFDEKIQVGERWDTRIEAELARCKVVVVLWSVVSKTSQWVLVEARAGMKRRALCPVLIENCDLPLEFSGVQTANLVAWRGDRTDRGFRALVDAIRQGGNGEAKLSPARFQSEIKIQRTRNAFVVLPPDIEFYVGSGIDPSKDKSPIWMRIAEGETRTVNANPELFKISIIHRGLEPNVKDLSISTGMVTHSDGVQIAVEPGKRYFVEGGVRCEFGIVRGVWISHTRTERIV